MSEEDQIKTTGRIVTDYIEAKKRLALMKSKAEEFSKLLESASLHINGEIQSVGHSGFELAIKSIPTSDQVLTACTEYKAELSRFKELQARISALGLQV